MNQIQIKTPSRLHFGLLGWGGSNRRQFGGLGLMTQDPGLELAVEVSNQIEATGPHSSRAISIAQSILERFKEFGLNPKPVHIQIKRAPDLHNGLGVGTQLSLAIARSLSLLFDADCVQPDNLAALTGRGQRSGIGIHGFIEGGFIVDAGRRDGSVPARIVRTDFPENWSILVVNPETPAGLHGPAELTAFRELPPIPETVTDSLCGIVMLRLLPAIAEKDLEEFGRSLTEIQERVGECFAPAQGGKFASPETERIVDFMKSLGLQGVGQSSWGPVLYGLSAFPLETRLKIRVEVGKRLQITEDRIFWTCACNRGSKIVINKSEPN